MEERTRRVIAYSILGAGACVAFGIFYRHATNNRVWRDVREMDRDIVLGGEAWIGDSYVTSSANGRP